jgi:hypothetical protein
MNFEFIPWIHQSHGFWWAMASMGLIAWRCWCSSGAGATWTATACAETAQRRRPVQATARAARPPQVRSCVSRNASVLSRATRAEASS